MKMILAADKNWGIGKDGGLLCHIPGDLAYFKEKTMGKTVLMGRVTLEGLPGGKGLAGRRNLIFTTREDYEAEEVEVLHSLEDLWQTLEVRPPEENDLSSVERAIFDRATGEVFVIGGAEIYRQFLPYCETVYVTKIQKEFPADRFFADMDADPQFELVSESEEQEENGIRYRFCKYRRV